MQGSPVRALVLCLLFGASSAASGVQFIKRDVQPFGYHSQEHFWLSAGGTFIGSQCLQIVGIERTPANWLSAGLIFGAGMSKEFILDSHPGVNDIVVDTLGVALGTVANITVHFDYFGRRKIVDKTRHPEILGDDSLPQRSSPTE